MFSSTMDWRAIDPTHVVVPGAPYPPRRASALPARSIGRQNTKGFKNSELLGAGGFGKVCRGVFGFGVLLLETWRAGTVPTHRPRHRRLHLVRWVRASSLRATSRTPWMKGLKGPRGCYDYDVEE